MPRVRKNRVVPKTNIVSQVKKEQEVKADMHYLPGLFDDNDHFLSKEHYLKYVMIPTSSKTSDHYYRYYLSEEPRKEYGKLERTNTRKRFLLDDHPDSVDLIEELLLIIGQERVSYSTKMDKILFGTDLFLSFTKSEYMGQNLTMLKEICAEEQADFYEYAAIIALSEIELRSTHSFFKVIADEYENFEAYGVVSNNSKGTLAYPSTVIYKLDYYARQEMKEWIEFYKTCKNALIEIKKLGNLFTLENLLKTRYEITGSENASFARELNQIILMKHGVNAESWNHRDSRKGKVSYRYRCDKERKKHLKLINISKNGINIAPKSFEMKLLWLLEVCPNWPFSKEIDPKYKGIMNTASSVTVKKLGLDNEKLKNFFVPSASVIYPLFLLILIRTGKNQLTILEWKIEEGINGNYELGLRLEDGGRKIRSIKSKTHTEDNTFLHVDREIDVAIETYLDWFGDQYKKSKYDNFFQGFYKESLSIFSNTRFQVASKKFTEKYKIYDPQMKKNLNGIKHSRIRPSFVGAQYLIGLKEFEVQLKLNHKDGATQHLHYENHTDVKEYKLRRIAKAQRNIVDLFKGKVVQVGNKRIEMGKGVLSDCYDSHKPSHDESQKLKNDEVCTDWTMCLLCDKSEVVKPIHCSVIIAMKHYLESKYDSIPLGEWEKEYAIIYDSVLSGLERFTKDEISLYEIKSNDHMALVESVFLMKRKRKTKKKRINETA